MLERPFKSCQVGSSEPQLAGPFYQVKTTFKLSLKPFDGRSSSVRGPVINDQDVKALFQGKNRPYDFLDILDFVLCRNDYKFCIHTTKILNNRSIPKKRPTLLC